MKGVRLIVVFAALGLLAGEVFAGPPDQSPAPPSPPAAQSDKASKEPAPKDAKHKDAENKDAKHKDAAHKDKETAHKEPTRKDAGHKDASRRGSAAPVSHAPPPQISTTASIPNAANAGLPARPAAARTFPPLAIATTTTTSPLELATVKQAIELAHKGRQDEATSTASTISDPLARKLVEWVILRGDDSEVDFSRYAAFIAANPSWPSIITLRRHAEAALWQDRADPQTVIGFFNTVPPLSAKGSFALARACLAQGDNARAQAAIHAAWREAVSEDLETQARQAFGELITPADDKARMDARFYAEDNGAGMRAAHHLDGAQIAIAKAWTAVNGKAGDVKALLEAVPQAAQGDAGYMFSRIKALRRADKIKEAAQWMLAAPHDPGKLIDLDQWWIERRLLARKMLDLGEAKTAYDIANGATPPPNENYRADQQFTAGWIALRFLHEPAIALNHFARITEGVVNPITLARSYYWQGRAAEALGHEQDARADYEAAAHYPTAYYGQLARARLDLDEVTLRQPPQPEQRPLEVARAFEILYSIEERDLVSTMAADIADKSGDAAAIAALVAITTRHNDARATLLLGKTALGHGLPFERDAFPDFGVPNYEQIGPQVERPVVFSIVRQESAFNPRDVSSANALGLMQVTPAAGRDTAKRFNVPFDQHRLMTDVAYNAQLGTAELGNDIASWRGSYILAFVAYNAGPRRAKEWIDQYGDPRDRKVDPIDWIERIPIQETRNYVQRVIENMQVYRVRLDNNPKLSIEADLRRGG